MKYTQPSPCKRQEDSSLRADLSARRGQKQRGPPRPAPRTLKSSAGSHRPVPLPRSSRRTAQPPLLEPTGPAPLPLQEETPRNDQNNKEEADGLFGFRQGRLIGPKRKSTLKGQNRRGKGRYLDKRTGKRKPKGLSRRNLPKATTLQPTKGTQQAAAPNTPAAPGDDTRHRWYW